ncbi:hypothetical protein [Rhodoligotrophos ferricapiens]|uniref:hypothetical protein n=1 Tax=Rhodoligotrophos ferricapiens TaxID=3069264 RepID=UPI00315D08AA
MSEPCTYAVPWDDDDPELRAIKAIIAIFKASELTPGEQALVAAYINRRYGGRSPDDR